MSRKIIFSIQFFLAFFMFSPCAFPQEALQEISLPQPKKTGGKPLMDCLNERKTGRDFDEKELELQQLSDLLWAAFGINRPENGKRTAPSAVNWQETDIYVALKSGVFIYNAKDNKLDPVVQGDLRSEMGRQAFVAKAPVVLVFVADYSRMGLARSEEDKRMYAAADVGFISQNVYLFCASEGLSTVVLGLVDRENISKNLKLKDNQKVVFSQCVGFPEEK